MKKLVLLLIVSVSLEFAVAMTRAQLKKTLTIMKNQCKDKMGIPESKIANIEKGDFKEDPDVKCYVACVYKTIQVIKNDKLNMEMVMKQVDILYPPDMKAAVKATIKQCIVVQDDYNEFCDRVFYAAKCLYEKDPPNFVFP
ncbi:general odorant-binding protein 19a-like [Pectinophora gossypiella]|uniref:general odorant-binding protein 19a-like n=1 Tax=Pectinophora gossypiella TaxID=13191 RepID=UPI00214E45A0|nr:general odorant-binding protein 19a-like [Pectinophora gossypiella]